MKVEKKGNIGFTRIFTSDNPDPLGTTPHKNPYIIFQTPCNQLNDGYLEEIEHLLSLGMTTIKDNNYILIITSARKIMLAIDAFYHLPEYKIKKNELLFLSLNKYKHQCELILSDKNPVYIPPKSKLISKFKKKDNSLLESSNVTYRIIKNRLLGKKPKEYVHKDNLSGRQISEIEVFNGFCYRLLLGKRHPKMISTHGSQGERTGMASELLSGFRSIWNDYEQYGPLTKEKLLKSEFIKILVASYTEEETDLHLNNYGFDDTNFCVKIDDDRSTWPLTAKYAGVDPEKGDPTGDYKTPPMTDFIVTERDIASFPTLQDAKPFHWLDFLKTLIEKNAWDVLLNEKKFINDKFYMFLKRILIPDEVYEAIAYATIGSEKTMSRFAHHKSNKTQKLKNALLNTPEFKEYVLANQHIIEQLKKEFAEYNEDYTKEKYHYLRVDLNQIEVNFNNICQEIKAQQSLSVEEEENDDSPTNGWSIFWC